MHKRVVSRPPVSRGAAACLGEGSQSQFLLEPLTSPSAELRCPAELSTLLPGQAPRAVSAAPVSGAWAEGAGGGKERVRV